MSWEEATGYERDSIDLGSGHRAEAMVGDTFFVPSQIIRFEDVVGTPRSGCVVSLPNRHQLIWHEIASAEGTITAINTLAQIGVRQYQTGPGSLTPDLYWWHRGDLTRLPVILAKGKTNFIPPDEFMELLDSLG